MSSPRQIADGIWLVEVALAEYDVRGVLILGRDRALVWDTLSRPRDMAGVCPLIGDRELVIAYSHADWDHVWGTGGLPHARARIVAHAIALQRFETDVPATLAERRRAEPGRWDDVALVAPTEIFEREKSIDLGGVTLMWHHLPGHTPDCVVGLIPERGILLAGDTVETPCPVVPPDGVLASWVTELRRWAGDERITTVIPAHGAIGGREILEQNVAYLDALAHGRPIEPLGPLTPFYRETHAQNLRTLDSRA